MKILIKSLCITLVIFGLDNSVSATSPSYRKANLSYHQNSILKSNASDYLLADFHETSESIFYSVQRNADSENLSENAVTDTDHSGYKENAYSRIVLRFKEPAIMMLLGAGLIGLSRLSKMMFKKSYKLTKVYNVIGT